MAEKRIGLLNPPKPQDEWGIVAKKKIDLLNQPKPQDEWRIMAKKKIDLLNQPKPQDLFPTPAPLPQSVAPPVVTPSEPILMANEGWDTKTGKIVTVGVFGPETNLAKTRALQAGQVVPHATPEERLASAQLEQMQRVGVETAPPVQTPLLQPPEVTNVEKGIRTAVATGGAAVGARYGLKLGSAIGTMIEPVGGTVVGGAIGTAIGAVGGAVTGYFAEVTREQKADKAQALDVFNKAQGNMNFIMANINSMDPLTAQKRWDIEMANFYAAERNYKMLTDGDLNKFLTGISGGGEIDAFRRNLPEIQRNFKIANSRGLI